VPLEKVERSVLVPASHPPNSATTTEHAVTSPAPNHESGGITQGRTQEGCSNNRSEAEVSLEGESSRDDQGGLGGEDQPYDQSCFHHGHTAHEPGAVRSDIRTDPLDHDGASVSG
jgi:hypothetical protein